MVLFKVSYRHPYSLPPNTSRPRRSGFNPWVGKIPWRRKWQLTPVFLPEKSYGQKSLVGYSLWGLRVRHDWMTNTHTAGSLYLEVLHPQSQSFTSQKYLGKKIPESPKKQNLNLPCWQLFTEHLRCIYNYLHSIYTRCYRQTSEKLWVWFQTTAIKQISK